MSYGRPRKAVETKCIVCCVSFMPIGSRPRKFCSHKCRDVYRKAQRVNEEEGTAHCAKCKYWKPIEEFVKGINGRPHSYCKPCSSEWFHDRNGTPKEERKRYRPAYRLTEEEKKENTRLRNHLQHQARRAAGQKPSKYDIQGLLCKQDSRCAYCKEYIFKKFHIDHMNPVSKGGTNDIENLQITCPRCNLIKGSMTHEEFLVSKKRRVVEWDKEQNLNNCPSCGKPSDNIEKGVSYVCSKCVPEEPIKTKLLAATIAELS